MRKNCPNCNTDNPIESQFCKSCGTRLDTSVQTVQNRPVSSITSDASKNDSTMQHHNMDDLLFVPKKKKSNLKWLLLILFILGGGFMFLVFLAWLGSEDTTTYDTSTTTTTTNYDTVFPLSYLEITKIDSEWVGGLHKIFATSS